MPNVRRYVCRSGWQSGGGAPCPARHDTQSGEGRGVFALVVRCRVMMVISLFSRWQKP
ncbi:MAG: hypothetical protein MZV63_60790 [Marinilabiliales bacterium]|nr:hypothetical protein [Marinilabiliales bacterium]